MIDPQIIQNPSHFLFHNKKIPTHTNDNDNDTMEVNPTHTKNLLSRFFYWFIIFSLIVSPKI